MNIEKVKDALVLSRDYINDGSLLPQDMNHPYFKTSEAIDAALAELEKPGEEAEVAWKKLLDHFAANNWRLNEDVCLEIFQSFAASYHAKKCADSWINSKDQLPEEGIDVLCFSRADDRLFVGTFTHYANKEKTWCDDECFGLTVDFWQPLPEPPHV